MEDVRNSEETPRTENLMILRNFSTILAQVLHMVWSVAFERCF